MPLTKEDIERIEKLGYSRSYFVQVDENGIPRLRNVNGHCVFLDPRTGRCKIYPYRPLGCRLYPLVYVPGEGVIVDPLCPKARQVPKDIIDKYSRYVIKLIKTIYGEEVLLED